MKLTKKISARHFIISQLFILTAGLIFLGWLYYLLNIQYQQGNKIFLNGPVTSKPKSLILMLDQPDDNTLTFQPSILISGKTGFLSDVLISTDSQDLVIQSKTDGSFSTVLNLDEGVNNITVVVFDPKGESRSSQRSVFYSKEKI